MAIAMLSGCAGGDATGQKSEASIPSEQTSSPADQQQETDDAATSTAIAVIDGREFSFELTGCTVYQDSEVEISGPGAEVDSDTSSYLDGGAVQIDTDAIGEFRIDIGATGPFQSSEEFLALGAPTGGDFSVVADGDGYVATGNTWDSNGTDLGTGTLHFTCR